MYDLDPTIARLKRAGLHDVFRDAGATSKAIAAGKLGAGLYVAGAARVPFLFNREGGIAPANDVARAALDVFVAEGLLKDG